ncbi:MAG TPA: thiosulfate oxidation carrier protein SoxY [Burkholderiaceae bacterium]|nr:thiosulfate oxidation carrier protein SoxY [Burkholderiaceae bacterium]
MSRRRRRAILNRGLGIALGVAARAGLGAIGLGVRDADAQEAPDRDAFAARSVADALARLRILDVADSPDVLLDAPDIAENGAVVPVSVRSRIAHTDAIFVLLDRNPFPLAARVDILDGLAPDVALRVKMAETAAVIAIVRADGRYWRAQRDVKITIGGCGG